MADQLAEIGPDSPTMCGDWTTRDLAAHIVVRDRRPDAMPGILSPKFAAYTDKVQTKLIESDDFGQLVEKIREGAPYWSPLRIDALDRIANTAEFFVHLEDVRRAQPTWKPRELDVDLTKDLYAVLKRSAKMMARKAPAGITLAPTGHANLVANGNDPMVVVSGPVGELVLWLYGRQPASQVSYDGAADAVEALRTASFGI